MTEHNSDHDAGVPAKPNASLAVLVASTLGASLSAVPQSQEAQVEGPIVPRSPSPQQQEVAARRSKSPDRRASQPAGPVSDSSDLDSGGSRKRISLTRLHFNSKKSAGSESSRGEGVTKRESLVSIPVASPPAMATAAARQESRTSLNSEHQIDIGEEFPIPKSSTMSGLIPRAPTGSEWSRSKSPAVGERDVVPLQEVLRDLDLKAGETLQRERLYSMQTEQILNKPISWEEDVPSNSHLWSLVDTREACHLAETQYCQQQKLQHPKGRAKVRCSACRILAHTQCIKQLYYEGYTCKDTFREIKQKVKETHVCHHFLHRRKLGGKCTKCDRGFGSWKKFTGREIVGYSCSWCGDSYHVPCYNGHQLRKEPCHFGPLRNLIIPPSWIVRTPPIEPSSPSVQSMNDSTNPRHSSRRKTRRSRRRKHDERASKFFTVKPLAQRQNKPLLVFLNPKSGGNQGAKLMQTFQYLLNPRQVFDLSQGGPKFGLKFFQSLSHFRIFACGGDGTVGWVLSILDELDIRPAPPVAVLPLGTGNDLSRVLKWGAGYTDEPLDKILMHVEEGPVVKLDRWQLNVWENPQARTTEVDYEGVPDVPLHVINNYFSIGADAQIALLFHNEREANPEKLNNQFKNKFFYFKAGSKDLMLRRFLSMTDHISLWCDGDDYTAQIRSLRLEAICFLNIPSYGSGTNPWGTPSSRDKFKPQSMEDGVIEVVGFWSSTFGKLQMGLARGERIAQCRHIKMVTDASLPVQIDGEACKLQPSTIEVGIKNTVPMIRRVARRNVETPLHGVRPSDRIKMSISKVTSEQYERLNSDLSEIRRIAKPLGLVVATSEDTLKTIRPQIDRYTEDDDDDGQRRLAKNWRFLDVATTGRVDRMFQVLPDQEDSISMGDILSDGLLVVEMDAHGHLPSISETPSNPQIMFSPEVEMARPVLHLPASEKRQNFGRNSSYEMACNSSPQHSVSPVSPPPTISPVREDLEVPQNPSLNSQDSSPPLTPTFSEEDATAPLLPNMADTGSDSQGTDTDVSATTQVQKSFLDAVKRGQLDKVVAFHQQGAILTAPDSNTWTPLHHAARLGRTEVVLYLANHIPKSALDLVEDEKLQTALHKAAWFGYTDICKILIDKGASPARTDYQYNTPYDKAVQSGDKELQQYLKGKSNIEEHQQDMDEDEMAI